MSVMPMDLECPCGATYHIRDGLGGQTVRCDACGSVLEIPEQTRQETELERDRYVVRREWVSVSEIHEILDEKEERTLLRATRPRRLFYRILARIGISAAGFFLYFFLIYQVIMRGSLTYLFQYSVGIFLTAAMFGFVCSSLFRPKRHLWFFDEEGRLQFWLWDLRRITFPFRSFALMEGGGELVVLFRRRFFDCLLRRTWRCEDAEGQLLFRAKEDSVFKSWFRRRLMRRLFPRMVGTTLLLEDAQDGTELGQFRRRRTLMDTYDLSLISEHWEKRDPRYAIGLCVLFSSVEGR